MSMLRCSVKKNIKGESCHFSNLKYNFIDYLLPLSKEKANSKNFSGKNKKLRNTGNFS